MPSARRFEELGIRARRQPEVPDAVQTPLRKPAADRPTAPDPEKPGEPT
jgi:hypothetical protein